ncbi:MAG: pyridoxamine 5'-phosphate oxidase family protein [Candidatus Bathyarchaeia archaeon]
MSMTWSPKIAMTKKEIDTFLAKAKVARVATLRNDSTIHITPIWYKWDGAYFWFILGKGERRRQHITNLRRDPRLSVIIDVDVRAEKRSLKPGAQAVVIRGKAELFEDEKTQKQFVAKWAKRYFGPAGAKLVDPILQDGKPGMNRVVVKVSPDKIIAWDFLKLEKS